MKRTLMVMTAVSALAVSAPAVSQPANANMSARIDQLQTQIQTGVQNRTIVRAEAQPLREQLRQLRQLFRHHSQDGLTRAERQELQIRIQNLRTQVRFAARNDTVQYGAAHWIDANRDGWDDRDLNRDGLIDTNFAQGGPSLGVQCDRRTGVAGILDTVLGRADCLRVGQRVPSGLYAVPQAYRDIYRDGNGVYYRSDGRVIYQIDARTHVVTGIFNL